MTLVYISLAWILGTLLGAYTSVPPWVCALSLLPVLLWRVQRQRRRVLIISACALLACVGAAALYPLRQSDPGELRQFNDGPPVTLTGSLDRAPEPRGEYSRL